MGMPSPVQPAPGQTISLDVKQLDELFSAPAADPFSTHEIDVLGQSGIDFLRKRFAEPFPWQPAMRSLRIRLPAAEFEAARLESPSAALAQQTQAAIQRYCNDQAERAQAEQRLVVLRAGKELKITLVVTVVALGLLLLLFLNGLSAQYGWLQGLLTLLAVFAVALTSWDALESLFFDWVPYAIDRRAYQWIGGLVVSVEPEAPAESGSPDPTAPQV